jgi:hypothetical protein
MTATAMPTPPSLPPRWPHIEWPTAIVLCVVLGSMVAVWALADAGERADILGGIGAAGSVLLAAMRAMLSRQGPPPPGHANGLDREAPLEDGRRSHLPTSLRVVALAALVVLPACGASALRTHATVGTVASVTVASTAPLVPAACDVALAGCRGDSACIDARAEDCRVAAAAHDATRVAVRSYLDAIEIASLADEGLVLDALRAGLVALAARWTEAVAALARVGLELPALPALVQSLLGGAS